MTRPVIFWGALMVALAAIGVTVFTGDARFAALMFGIGGFMVVLGLVLAVTGLGESPARLTIALPGVSPPTACAGAGLVLVALGAVWGLWLILIGAGVLLVGAAGVARELRAQRRDLQEVDGR
ncbi:MAG: hypothetical protein JWM71_1784 [Solirubrobacteraceae bacterium]|nr:hypothetical protein [Solirubrobacteraceae bacterium]